MLEDLEGALAKVGIAPLGRPLDCTLHADAGRIAIALGDESATLVLLDPEPNAPEDDPVFEYWLEPLRAGSVGTTP